MDQYQLSDSDCDVRHGFSEGDLLFFIILPLVHPGKKGESLGDLLLHPPE
jgi:hypothetical protein